MLTLGWSDGHSFVPTQMELPANAVSDKRIGPDPTLDGRTHAGKRAGQACRKATEVALEMVERSGQQQVPADYVTFDSWFAQPGLLARISEQLPVVCMLKNHPNVLYRQGKRIYTLERLYHKVASRTRSNPEGPIIGSITVQMLSGPNLRVVFVRDQQDPDQWGALASSDLQITPQHICRIYAKRWAIEVFFKQTKQQLGLDSELQVRSYTACVAFTSIVFIRYMMLSFYQRQCTDNRTIPGLFYAGCEQLQAITLQCCLQIVLTEILRALFQSLPAEGFKTACAISGVIEHFAQNLVANSMTFKPLTCTCES